MRTFRFFVFVLGFPLCMFLFDTDAPSCVRIYVRRATKCVSCSFVRTKRTQASQARACTRSTVKCISHRDDWSPSHSNLLLVSLFPIRVLLFLPAPADLHLC